MKVIYGQQYLKELHQNKKTTDKRYEKLLGNKQGVSSVRVNDKYRIEFEEHFEKGQAFATICNIIELSNHYN